MLEVRLYQTAAGRSQPRDFLADLPAKDALLILADIEAFRQHGLQAPISLKTIKGKPNRGMAEIRTGNFRTLYCMKGRVVWVLHICKKEHQDQGIAAARERMAKL